MFLTPSDLQSLTDYKRAPQQIRWLRQHGYRFELSGAGRPKVLWQEVERHMLSKQRRKDETGPRLELVD